jgi:integrase
MLYRKRNRHVWIYRTKVNGKTWERSIKETARRKVKELKRLAQLHREQPQDWLKLSQAIVREVNRIEQDVSKWQASRVSASLEKFRSWADDITLNQINSEMVERYQRCQLRKCARSTVDKDINYLLRLLRQNGFQVERPSSKRGKTTEVRALTQDELKRFFAACSPEHKPMFLLMLVTGLGLLRSCHRHAMTMLPYSNPT